MSSGSTSTESRALQAAQHALSSARWIEAAALFREVAARFPKCVQAWEGLAVAAYWIPDEETILSARERAYQLYREQGDSPSAARMAAWLAVDTIELKGLEAVGNGWMQRAKRLIAGHKHTPAGVVVALLSARVLVLTGADMSEVCRTSARAAARARTLYMPEAEALSLAMEGMARLCVADISRAVPCLDEAAAIVCGGEVSDLTFAALTLCSLMAASERTRDFDRAQQWCAVARQFSDDQGFPVVLSICRPHYGAVLMWRGHWQEAEEHLRVAGRELMEFMPAFAIGATAQLGILRWRQGRWDEAEKTLESVRGEAPAQLGIAELLVGKGDLDAAIDVLERHIRQLPAADKLERGPVLDLLVRCLAAVGRVEKATGYLEELRACAASVRVPSLRAAAAMAEGAVASATGKAELATGHLGDAVALYERAGAPFESARARIALAQAFLADGRPDAAAREAFMAHETMLRVGAPREASRAQQLLARIKQSRTVPANTSNHLTMREQQILGLLAEGRSNQDIADDLTLSIRTVERHISNIYSKLGLEGRTARTAAAAHSHRTNPAISPSRR
jgi:DNA-binding CsgD family transcriptional regulator